MTGSLHCAKLNSDSHFQYRYGPFTALHALLPKHFYLECLLNNMVLCENILHEHRQHLQSPPAHVTQEELEPPNTVLPEDYAAMLRKCDIPIRNGGLMNEQITNHARLQLAEPELERHIERL